MTPSEREHGKVYLVGAGPGDPGLISLRAVECLARADLVLYDLLVNAALLEHAAPHARCECLGQPGTGRTITHDEIVAKLVAESRAGRTAVRLKGGDPFVFGRGGEEAESLHAAGIPFEVVPAPTAGIAAPAYAGIPVTHRDRASAVALVTGHEDPAKSGDDLDWPALARFPGTLVFYMAMGRIDALTQQLQRVGKPPETPVAVVCWGTLPRQKTVRGTLANIAHRSQQSEMTSPAVIVVGDVAALGDRLDWFSRRALFGQRVVVTRPRAQAGSMIHRLNELGAEALLLPTVRIEPPDDWTPVDRAIRRLDETDWLVFTSANGVRFFLGRLLETGDLRRLGAVRLAAIGPGTAAALADFHLRPDLMPDRYVAEALAEALAPLVAGKRVLLARADRGREVLQEILTSAGARVERLTAYRNVDETHGDPDVLDRIRRGEVDWVTLTSSAIARALTKLLEDRARQRLGRDIKLASISPVTSAAARELGWEVTVEARSYTPDGVIDAIIEHVAGRTR